MWVVRTFAKVNAQEMSDRITLPHLPSRSQFSLLLQRLDVLGTIPFRLIAVRGLFASLSPCTLSCCLAASRSVFVISYNFLRTPNWQKCQVGHLSPGWTCAVVGFVFLFGGLSAICRGCLLSLLLPFLLPTLKTQQSLCSQKHLVISLRIKSWVQLSLK